MWTGYREGHTAGEPEEWRASFLQRQGIIFCQQPHELCKAPQGADETTAPNDTWFQSCDALSKKLSWAQNAQLTSDLQKLWDQKMRIVLIH